MTGNNTPVFFIRDPIKVRLQRALSHPTPPYLRLPSPPPFLRPPPALPPPYPSAFAHTHPHLVLSFSISISPRVLQFPDFIHTQKRNARTNLKDPDAHWDFASLVPESIHQFTVLFSDRGTPDGYRHLNGYSSHTLKLVNADGKATWAKFHFKTDQKIRNLSTAEAGRLSGANPDYATQDLFEAIERGEYPSWTVQVQLMPYEQALTYRFNPFDVTKVWPHKDFPVLEVGKLVLNRNPDNYFAEVEQAAFSPSHLVPGIEPSPDKMLQGRLFSYPDTHRHRLGPNYQLIPINSAYNARVLNYQRDGFMRVDGNGGSGPNYEPNSFGGPTQVGAYAAAHPAAYSGQIERAVVALNDDDFVQAGALYRLMTPEQKANLVNNIAGHLKNAKKQLQQRQLAHFKRADAEYGARIEAALVKLQQKL